MAPLALELLDAKGTTSWLTGDYKTISSVGNVVRCVGEIRTRAGTGFEFVDDYAPGPVANSFVLTRKVAVLKPAEGDWGFMTRFELAEVEPSLLRDHDFFVPGIWYRDNAHVSAGALAADMKDDAFVMREDRMPLPLVMMRDKRSGTSITLVHLQPSGQTCLPDNDSGEVVDGRIQVASLGVVGQQNPAVVLCFPGSEGERSYVGMRPEGNNQAQSPVKRWAERFHPVQSGVVHTYKLLIVLSSESDFPRAMRRAWRTAFAQFDPPISPADIAAAYNASISLISDWSMTHQENPGLPFRLALPIGGLESPQFLVYQMGFVGQQLPLAYHLLRYGLQHQDEEIVHKGEAIVDFWAKNSLTLEGLPRTWFSVYPESKWLKEMGIYLRGASDGMVGALMAWDVMKRYGREKPEWIKFCRDYGDWLVSHQSAEGAWCRQYDWNSRPLEPGTQCTSHPIRFLVDLAKATEERKYLDAALRAGEFCWAHEYLPFTYVGGTEDNQNVIDKEAGFMALDAFLALHDATGDAKWLKAAIQAADFTETWVYCWEIPMPADDHEITYPRGATTIGFSLIATGHSGADLFMAGAPFMYYRLYLQTGDAHYQRVAQILLYNTKQAMDINGSLGYGHTGLCTEALWLAPPRGHGVNTWLPWLTYSMIEPITKLQDAYGKADTPLLDDRQLDEFRAKDQIFGQSRGLFTGGAK